METEEVCHLCAMTQRQSAWMKTKTKLALSITGSQPIQSDFSWLKLLCAHIHSFPTSTAHKLQSFCDLYYGEIIQQFNYTVRLWHNAIMHLCFRIVERRVWIEIGIEWMGKVKRNNEKKKTNPHLKRTMNMPVKIDRANEKHRRKKNCITARKHIFRSKWFLCKQPQQRQLKAENETERNYRFVPHSVSHKGNFFFPTHFLSHNSVQPLCFYAPVKCGFVWIFDA